MDHQGEIKRLRARIAELEIDAKAVQTGLLMRENLSELQAAKKTPAIRHLPAHIALRAVAWRGFSPGPVCLKALWTKTKPPRLRLSARYLTLVP